MSDNISLRQYLADAITLNYCSLEQTASDRAKGESWQSPMFTFIRVVKAHPKLRNLSARDAAIVVGREMESARMMWHLSFPESVDPLAEFVSTWDRVMPIDGDPVSLAWSLAVRLPVTTIHPPISPKYALFVSLAYHLQRRRGSASILLPVAKLGRLLGVDFRTVSFYRKIAESDGLLERAGDGYRYKEGHASEFFFRVKLFDAESRNQISHWNQDKQDSQDLQDLQDKEEPALRAVRHPSSLASPDATSASNLSDIKSVSVSGNGLEAVN